MMCEARPLQLSLFGGLECRLDGRSLALPPSSRCRSLIGYLALRQGNPPRRDFLAFTLWPDSSEEQARTNLRRALFDLFAAAPDLRDAVNSNRATLSFSAQQCAVDVEQFERLHSLLPRMTTTSEPSAETLERLEAIADLYRGEMVPELDDDWFALPRERYRRQAREVLLTLAHGHRARGETARSLTYAERLAALDPFDEEAHRFLFEQLWRGGQVERARVAFRSFRQRLESELGSEPEPETLALMRRVERPVIRPTQQQIAETFATVAPPSPTWDFVGRTRELAELGDVWERASSGQGEAVVLLGPPGIGKTRLALQASEMLSPRPATVLFARCQADGAPPFAPLSGAVRAALRDRPTNQWPSLGPPWDSALASFLPELGDRTRDSGVRLQHVHEGWTLLLRRGFASPLVFVIDDLQWADESTLAYLGQLVETLAVSPMLVIATARDADITPESTLGVLIARGARVGRIKQIQIDELDQSSSEKLARSVRPEIDPLDAISVSRRSGGHPFFLVELAQSTRQKPNSNRSEPLPTSIQSLVNGQVVTLDADSRTILEVLSVLGLASLETFSEALEWRQERVAAALQKALRQHLVVDTGANVAFKHDLVRETILSNLPGPTRRAWHSRVAIVLDQRRDPDLAGSIAQHLLSATNERSALPHLLEASEIDLRRSATDSAASRFGQAAAIADRLGLDAERARALLGLGRANLNAGDVSGAVEAFQRLRVLGGVTGRRSDEIDAMSGLIQCALASDRLEHGLQLYREILRVPGWEGEEAAQRAVVRATNVVSELYGTFRPLWTEGREHLTRALALAETLGEVENTKLLRGTLIDLTSLVAGPWSLAVEELRQIGDHFCTAWASVWMGRAHDAVGFAELAAGAARRKGDLALVSFAQVILGTAVGLAGDYRTGFETIDQARKLAGEPPAQVRHFQAALRITVWRELRMWDAVLDDAVRYDRAAKLMGAPDTPFDGIVESSRLLALAMQGRSESLALLERRSDGPIDPDYVIDRMYATVAQSEAAMQLGRAEHALQAAERASRLAESMGAAREFAHAARIRASASSRLGAHLSAEAHFVTAATAAAHVGEPGLRLQLLRAQSEHEPHPVRVRAVLAATEAIRAQLPDALRPVFREV